MLNVDYFVWLFVLVYVDMGCLLLLLSNMLVMVLENCIVWLLISMLFGFDGLCIVGGMLYVSSMCVYVF